MGYTELYFGHADAQTEAIREPESFVKSFVNHGNIVNAVIDDGRFLVLGPKGTGKSALAWYLDKTGRDRDLVVHTRDVSELPIAEVDQLKTGESPGLSRSLNAWRFIILCALLDVILKDESSALNRNPEALEVIGKLREYGFLDPTPKNAILRASTRTWKVPIPKIGEIYSKESVDSLHLVHLIPYLEKWAFEETGGNNKHFLILDGLDSIYINDDRYIPAMSALVQSALSVNQHLRAQCATGGVVLLIRNDIYSRLDLPDGGKLRTDWGIELDWRTLSGDAKSASLFDLVDAKAVSLIGKAPFDVVEKHFPEKIELAGGKQVDTFAYLLSLTRHTPRDLLQLLEHIRSVESGYAAASRGPKVRPSVVREGVLQYATKYFVDAVRNELVGRGGPKAEGRFIVDALRDLSVRRFNRSDFEASLEKTTAGHAEAPKADDALRWLFFAGAIGNEAGTGASRYLQFFHRRDDNDIHLGGTLVLHNALVHAWAIPWGSSS
ncbi:P-loop ATPase, Sll1717 family [Arthrobacter sp. 7Tela_A1]|uniref:P-loop ATPase, Sll1717 family n=1 Tax=Arthrobacter sp. 7Tela_A1 TaxID=3093745 RepID=UPI003BB67C49